MTDRREALKQQLEASRRKLMEAISGMSEADWQIPVQSDGEHWTALQMIRHLQDAHRGLTGQVKRIMEGKRNLPDDFDINRWNAGAQKKTAEANMTPEQAIEALRGSHAELLALIDQIKDEDFQRTGWQAALQQELPLEKFIEVIAGHEGRHAGEIAAAVKK